MRKRKPRIPCRIDGCESPIMYDRLMCHTCWMRIPVGIRKKHTRVWRELRPFIRRSDNALVHSKEDAVHVLGLVNAHKESCDECLSMANDIRIAKGIEPDNEIENELKEMGLI